MTFLLNRRSLLARATLGGVGAALGSSAGYSATNSAMGPLRRVQAGVLQIGYHDFGPAGGPPVVLLHGFPYDVHSYVDVAPILAVAGHRVIVPHLRGHGPTRFLDPATPRSGQQAAIGADLHALLDALHVERALLAGYDWGGRAACVVAALHPERCAGLVSVNSYLIQDISKAAAPAPARVERGFWYQFYFSTERGRTGLGAHRNDIARIMWSENSPTWRFDQRTFERSAAVFDNPDYVDVVIHSYRHRLGLAAGMPAYEPIEQRLAALPSINVPTITLDGEADGVVTATNGIASAAHFTAYRQHRKVPGVGHNLPQEAPQVFAQAVRDVSALSR